MPRRDGTGPRAQGALTGRGLGLCNSNNASNDANNVAYGYAKGLGRCSNITYGYGRGLGLGRGNYCRRGFVQADSSKEFLAAQKKVLETKLEEINKQLDS